MTKKKISRREPTPIEKQVQKIENKPAEEEISEEAAK